MAKDVIKLLTLLSHHLLLPSMLAFSSRDPLPNLHIAFASPQAPIHFRSHSVPIKDNSSRAKPDNSSQPTRKPDTRPILTRSPRTVVAASSSQTTPFVLTPSKKEADSQTSPPRPPRSPLPLFTTSSTWKRPCSSSPR